MHAKRGGAGCCAGRSLSAFGVAGPAVVAEQLVMLRAGAMAVASVGSTDRIAFTFTDAWTALIDRTV